jgi:uncharacterized protein involved in exopolysaccharide biosynthesis
MELQSRRNNAGKSEELEPIELPVSEKNHQSVYPYFVEPESPLLHYWRILKKRRWTVAATLGIIFTLSVITTLNTTRLYQATSKVAIFPETPNVLGFKDQENSSPDYQYDVTLETQAAILRSDALAMKVIEAMHLDQNPTFAGATGAHAEDSIRVSSMQPDPARAAGLLGAFRGGLNVQSRTPVLYKSAIRIQTLDWPPKSPMRW